MDWTGALSRRVGRLDVVGKKGHGNPTVTESSDSGDVPT